MYENRVKRKAQKKPEATLAEARGHKPPPLPATATEVAKNQRAIAEQASRLRLQAKVGEADPAKVKKAQKILGKMRREVQKMEPYAEKGVGEKLSSLEWTIWSQEQKKRELEVKALLNKTPDPGLEKAQGALDKIAELSKKMQDMNPKTKKYQAAVKRLERLNDTMAAGGFEAVGNVAVRTSGANPNIEKGRVLLDKMIAATKLMWEKYPPGTTRYYEMQRKLAAYYKRLKALGMVDASGKLLAGDVGYH